MVNIDGITQAISETVTAEVEAMFEESRRDLEMRALQIEDIGWRRLYGEVDSEEGFSLDSIKSLSEDLYDMVATSPLISRGVQLRHGYTFGKGFETVYGSKVTETILSDPYNYESLLAPDATERLLIEDAAAGNAFHIKVGNGKTAKIISVPLSQITGIITDEDDAQRVQYFQRTWNANGVEKVEWIPLHRYKKTLRAKLPMSISSSEGDKEVPVSQNSEGFMYTGMRPAGWTFGIPTALAAKAWLVMYTESLQNNALLVKMMSQFAWKIVSKTGTGAKAAGAAIASQKGVGATVSATEGQDVQAVPRGNDVNFNNIQPLAAMIATQFGVPVIALLSSPGATGGSYGAATTLDEPTMNVMSTLRTKLKAYIEEILNALVPNSKDATILSFPSMTTDADYRKVQALSVAYTTGALHQSEYRAGVLEIYPLPVVEAGLPKGDGFNAYSDPNQKSEKTSGAVSGQGKQGNVAGGMEQGETNHDNDNE